MCRKAEQNVEHGLGGEQQRGNPTDAQPPVREGNARGREQSGCEHERPDRRNPSARQCMRKRGDEQARGGQRQAAPDPAVSATEPDLECPHSLSLGIRVGRRKCGGDEDLEELIIEVWLDRPPWRLANGYLGDT
jgi:hypothetical protein